MKLKNIAILILIGLFVSGCKTTDRKGDSPNDIDNLKISPCVCIQLDYEDRGYKWAG